MLARMKQQIRITLTHMLLLASHCWYMALREMFLSEVLG